jgi:NAD(P)-dependent dehydrogenase (short-subunit alcohol dehydrogenase family)
MKKQENGGDLMAKKGPWETSGSLAGRLVAITGATGGLGRVLCRECLARGANLLLLDRNEARSTALRRELQEEFPSATIRGLRLDLEDVASVFLVTERLKAEPIDVLIQNAGAYSIPRSTTAAGYDNVFQINFASPYYMIRTLLPCLRARRARVVAVGSIAHRYSRTDSADVDFSGRKRASLVYGNAKRYLMFSLYDLWRGERETTLAVTHPGITLTNITAHYPKWIYALIKHPMKLIFMSPRKAAQSILRGVFVACEANEWIGPRICDVWGAPQKRRLHSVDPIEQGEIAHTAEAVYERMATLREARLKDAE